MNSIAESGRMERGPQVSTSFSLSVGNEWADAERDGRISLARSNS